MKQGDLVVRQSYGGDVVFRIEDADQDKAILRGVEFRLLADSPLEDLRKIDVNRGTEDGRTQSKIMESINHLQKFKKTQREKVLETYGAISEGQRAFFEVPGKVLHLDGDPAYLRKSMKIYKELGVPARGYFVREAEMESAVNSLLPQIRPEILVITGHDGILKHRKDEKSLNSYKNSFNFVNAVKAARQYERNRDTLTIIAGACQSHFEALLQAGANFASSPARILIHALDPVNIAAKLSFTPMNDTVNMYDILHYTISGLKGVGGIETRGNYRIGLPKLNM
jgi:spore coat assembly protein